jgi:sigma-B regulation protein RsbU (phosphoserine phosphatase)
MIDSFVQALNGPLLAKAGFALLIVGFFSFLRRKDTEGAMALFVAAGAFLFARDLLYAFLPSPELFRASDLLVFCALLFLANRPFGLGPIFWAALAIAGAAFALLLGKAFLGLLPSLDAAFLTAASFAPIAAAAIVPLLRVADADTASRRMAVKSAFPLAIASTLHVAATVVFGPEGFVAQGVTAPILYACLVAMGLFYVDFVQAQLAGAVEYYEESVESLYAVLLAAGAAMKPGFTLQEVLDSTIAAIVDETGAEGGLILLVDEFEDSVSVRALRGSYPPPFKLPENLPRTADRVEAFLRHARFKLGEGIFGEAAKGGKQVFVPRAGPESPLPDNGDEDYLRSGGLIVLPLIVRDRIIGAISIAKAGAGSFIERDFDRSKLLADFASIAVANTFSYLEAAERSDIEREASIAEEVQASLKPAKLPDLKGYSFGAHSSPAHGVCSDYFDIIQPKPDRLLLAVGDVAGKGVAASLVMVMIRSILHLITASTKDAATLLQWINRGLRGKVDLDHYATLGLVDVDAETGELEYASAGQQYPIVYRAASGETEVVELKGLPIGVERAASYATRRFSMAPGDVLVLYTDGIVETMNSLGKQFGAKNLALSLERNHDAHPRDIAAAIKADLDDFSGRSRQHDDQTILVMKAK